MHPVRVILGRAGKRGQAIFLSGQEARVRVPADPALDTDDAFTLAAWVNPSAYLPGAEDIPAVIGKWNYPEDGDYLLNVQGCINEGLPGISITNIQHDGSAPQLDGIVPPSDGERSWRVPVSAWTHLGATFDHGLLRLFVNGQLAAEKKSDVLHTSLAKYPFDDVIIGNIFTDINHNYTWQGAIDEVRFYGRALDEQEIACLAE